MKIIKSIKNAYEREEILNIGLVKSDSKPANACKTARHSATIKINLEITFQTFPVNNNFIAVI